MCIYIERKLKTNRKKTSWQPVTQKMAESNTVTTNLYSQIFNFMLKYLLPLPIVRRTFKVRQYIEQAVFEKHYKLPDNVCEVVRIGSQYEGLSVAMTSSAGGDAIYSLSDYGVMPVLKGYLVRDPSHPKIDKEKEKENYCGNIEILEINEASHAGYCKLRSLQTGKFVGMQFNADCTGKIDIYHDGEMSAATQIPYSDLIIPGFYHAADNVEVKTFVHGPAISCTNIQVHPGGLFRTGQEVDVVLALKCQRWPVVATEWFQRLSSSDWPSLQTRDKVKLTSCYVVAVAHKLSPNPHQEWRYSFAAIEKQLAHSFTFAQRGSYIVAKMLFKAVFIGMDTISSYCLKTQMFWTCEKESRSSWTYDNMGVYALKVLSELAENLHSGVLRHYIIPENNIIDHLPGAVLHVASKKLTQLVQNPLPAMQQIRHTTTYFAVITHPPDLTFMPVTSMFQMSAESNSDISSRFLESELAIMKHYCSMLKKPITNKIQEHFSRLKFALLVDIAEAISRKDDSPYKISDIMNMIERELLNVNAENVPKWKDFVQEYHKELDSASSKSVEEIMKADAF